MRRTAVTLICLGFCLAAAGCGIKPGFVDPPQGRANDHFPRTYPDPASVQK